MTAKKTTKKVAVKKVAVKKAAKKAVKSVAKKSPPKKSAPPFDTVAKIAYQNYRHRMDQGLPGDHASDWHEAERSLAKG